MENLTDFLKRQAKVKRREITYFNDKGEIVSEDEAVSFIANSYDEHGNSIERIYGSVNRKGDDEKNERD